jgi:circadian clock protein KaiB
VYSYFHNDCVHAAPRSRRWGLVRGRSGAEGVVTEEGERPAGSATEAFERALAALDTEPYVLRLYVAGNGVQTRTAIENVRRVCEERLRDRFDLEIVDLHQNPTAVTDDLVLATPTLVRRLPTPLRSVVGDLSETEKVLVGLALIPRI